ncbi:MAG: hypothetical protein HF973_19740 [Chloroflexi bacterium]|nr:hypothetical protein [Chloroflexota bacterium]
MGRQSTIQTRNVSELRVTVRILTMFAIVAGLIYTRVFINSGVLEEENSVMAKAAVGLLLLAVLGLAMAFRWEKWGGILAIAGGLGLGLIAFVSTGSWIKAMLYSGPFLITGLLSLAAWRRFRTAPSSEKS